MRPIYKMEIIQIDITNSCVNECANCTRFCGHHQKNFFMDMSVFKQAVDSLVDFPGMVGMIGGEPLLHPNFEEMACYLEKRVMDKKRRGLWSTAPRSKDKYGDLIQRVFGNLYLNNHTLDHILHQPILVAAQDVIENREEMWRRIDNCWVQTLWSASITPKGAFFCEVAASMDMLFEGPGGWPVEPGWWKRGFEAFTVQSRRWCPGCGCAVPLQRRSSIDRIDDVSPTNLERLKKVESPRVKKGQFVLWEQGLSDDWNPDPNWYMSEVEDEHIYRERIKKEIISFS